MLKFVKSGYLFLYNVAMMVGWATIFVQVVHAYITEGALRAYASSNTLARYLQIISLLETVHASTGIVRSGVGANLMQWAGRTHALFAVVHMHSQMHDNPCACLMLAAWGFGEACRYPWYAFSQIGKCPDILTWLRYTAFIPVYPAGMIAEVKCMWDVLPYVRQSKPFSLTMPNSANIAFDYATFISILIPLYPVVWFQLYSMMWRQRGNKLGKKKSA